MYKKILLALMLLCFAGILLIFPNLCIDSAQKGLLLWFNKILPSLLPFIILINMLGDLNIMKSIGAFTTPITQKLWHLPGCSLFAFLMGLIAGYPMGGKIIKQLVDHEDLSPSEAEKTLCFCNNCGPLFIIGTVGTMMLYNTALGYFLLVIHILSALLNSFIFSSYVTQPLSIHTSSYRDSNTSINFSSIFNHAVMNAMDTIVCVGGYIIFFSVVTKLVTDTALMSYIIHLPILRNLPATDISGLFTSLLELSNGTNTLASTSSFSLFTLALISSAIGFGGLCVYFQTLYVLGDTSIRSLPYFCAKFLQGFSSFLLTYLLYPLFYMYTQKTYYPIQWLPLILLLLLIVSSKCLIKLFTKTSRKQKCIRLKWS